jgi:DNA-binding SARP family transcriptional activator
MDFRLLGPLEVSDNERSLALGGVKQRSLLAVLLLQANEFVSTYRLIDQLWGPVPPATALKGIHVYVSRLRKTLGEARLATGASGYALRVEPEELDLARFEQLAAEARRASPEGAARKLREALSLWRGPALADLAYEPFAQVEIARLGGMGLAVGRTRFSWSLTGARA